jgi:RNA polymerase sigma-70 factor (ECF subfamily)
MLRELSHDSAGTRTSDFTDGSAVRAWLESADESAAVWLYDKYLPLVRHVCSRSFLLPHAIEDATQDALSRAFQSLPNFEQGRCLASWFASIARHVCLDRWRSISRRNEVDFDSSEEAREVACGEALELHQRLRSAEEADHLLGRLAPDARELFELRYAFGLSNSEIARRTGLAAGNVAIRLMRARQTLAATAVKKQSAGGALLI